MSVRGLPLGLALPLLLILSPLVTFCPSEVSAHHADYRLLPQVPPLTPSVGLEGSQGTNPGQPPARPASAVDEPTPQAVPVPPEPSPEEVAGPLSEQPAMQEPPSPVPPLPVQEPPLPVPPTPVPPTPVPPTPVVPTPPPVAPTPPPAAPPEAERPRPERPPEAALLERGAILLPRGTLQIEPSIEYVRFSGERIAISGFTIFEAIVIGTIRVDRINRDIVTGALAGRYGVLDRLQVDARVPYVIRRDTEILGVGTPTERERSIEGRGLGDLEGTISGQALIGGGAVPDVILRVQGRLHTGKDPFRIRTVSLGPGGETRLVEAPTGSGFNSMAPGATLVWRSDPVVFFLGGSYSLSFGRDLGGLIGKIDPGPSIQVVAGLNLAVSERIAVSVTAVDQITQSTKQNGIKRTGTSLNDARLILGTSISLHPKVSLLVSAGFGLTRDSPDFIFTLSLPLTFKLF